MAGRAVGEAILNVWRESLFVSAGGAHGTIAHQMCLENIHEVERERGFAKQVANSCQEDSCKLLAADNPIMSFREKIDHSELTVI